MKKLIITLGLFFVIGIANPVEAQNVNINVNVDKQPAWGPTGYDYAEFYYFPDINIYFDVNSSVFHYLSGSKWVSNQYLPSKYSKYDLYTMYKVVVSDKQPWLQNKNHKKSYSAYKGNKTQQAIRYSSNSKYNNSKSNDRNWVNMNDFSNNNKGKNTNNSNNSNNKGNNKTESNKNSNKDRNSSGNSHR